jgi:hypothetical protein
MTVTRIRFRRSFGLAPLPSGPARRSGALKSRHMMETETSDIFDNTY